MDSRQRRIRAELELEVEMDEVQAYLNNKFLEFQNRVGHPVRESWYAINRAHTSPGTWSSWTHGRRKMDYASTIMLSTTDEFGMEIFEVTHYPPVVAIKDTKLLYVVRNWNNPAMAEIRDIIYEHVKEEVTGKAIDPNEKPDKQGGDGKKNIATT